MIYKVKQYFFIILTVSSLIICYPFVAQSQSILKLPIIQKDILVMSQGDIVFAVNKKTGKIIWNYSILPTGRDNYIQFLRFYPVKDGFLLIKAENNKEIVKINLNGELLWKKSFNDYNTYSSVKIISSNDKYALLKEIDRALSETHYIIINLENGELVKTYAPPNDNHPYAFDWENNPFQWCFATGTELSEIFVDKLSIKKRNILNDKIEWQIDNDWAKDNPKIKYIYNNNVLYEIDNKVHWINPAGKDFILNCSNSDFCFFFNNMLIIYADKNIIETRDIINSNILWTKELKSPVPPSSILYSSEINFIFTKCNKMLINDNYKMISKHLKSAKLKIGDETYSGDFTYLNGYENIYNIDSLTGKTLWELKNTLKQNTNPDTTDYNGEYYFDVQAPTLIYDIHGYYYNNDYYERLENSSYLDPHTKTIQKMNLPITPLIITDDFILLDNDKAGKYFAYKYEYPNFETRKEIWKLQYEDISNPK